MLSTTLYKLLVKLTEDLVFHRDALAELRRLVAAAKEALGAAAENSPVSFLPEDCTRLAKALEAAGHSEQAALAESFATSQRPLVAMFLDTDQAPQTVPEVYLKLHLLSHRLVKPHGLDLTGMFGLLRNIAWTNEGAIDIEELPARRLKARLAGRALSVDCVDKFPKMTDYVVPTGIRIGDTARVRLGAYLGEGTLFLLNSRENKWLENQLKLTELQAKWLQVYYDWIYAHGHLNYRL